MVDNPVEIQHSEHFGDYSPPDFGWGGAEDPESNPSMLVPLEYRGVSFGSCHRDAHGLFIVLLKLLVPSIKGGLHPGSCGCYNPRSIIGTDTRSFHSWGIAVDINWNVNHMGTNIPDAHGEYANPRHQSTNISRMLGMEWGGDWQDGYHDDMHFEIHLSPQVSRQIQPIDWKKKPGFPYLTGDVIGMYVDPSPHVHGGANYEERLVVLHVQHRLQSLGFSVDLDGVFSAHTDNAVRNWQKKDPKLKVTGQIGSEDWTQLFQPSPNAKPHHHQKGNN